MTVQVVVQENRCVFCDGPSSNPPGRLCETCFRNGRPLFDDQQLVNSILAGFERMARNFEEWME